MTVGQSTPGYDLPQGSERPQLSPAAVRVYECAAANSSVCPDEVPGLTMLSEEAARAASDELLALGLLSPLDADKSRLAAVSPNVALMCSVAPRERAARRVQRDLSALRDQVEALLPAYMKNTGDQQADFVVLPRLDTVRAVITELAAGCNTEVLTAQPGGARPEEVLQEARERTDRMLSRGVSMRTLYQHAAQFSPTTRTYAELLIEQGVQVRTVTCELQRMIVFDRRAALLSLRGNNTGALLVREPSTLDFITAVFEQSWVTAAPFPAGPATPQPDQASGDLKLTITQLLAEGHSDRTIARRLGISQRTCQRHVAELFAQYGARNRFHAGYLIHQAGVLADTGGEGDGLS